jgi:hypothetical protein
MLTLFTIRFGIGQGAADRIPGRQIDGIHKPAVIIRYVHADMGIIQKSFQFTDMMGLAEFKREFNQQAFHRLFNDLLAVLQAGIQVTGVKNRDGGA